MNIRHPQRMNILSLPGPRLSLEFAQADFETVKAGLRYAARKFRCPMHLRQHAGVTHDILDVGGVRFILMVDDGDPCLVSMTARGNMFLREVVHYVAERQTPHVGMTERAAAVF